MAFRTNPGAPARQPIELCPRCHERGHHPGIAPCALCAIRILRILAELPELYVALLTPPERGSTGSTGSSGEPAHYPAGDAALDAREAIRAFLTRWSGPVRAGTDVEIRELVGDLVDELPDLLRPRVRAGILAREVDELGRLRAVAWPGRRTGVVVACPTVLGPAEAKGDPDGLQVCGRRVLIDADAGHVTCPRCGRGGVVGWWVQQLQTSADLVPLGELADWLLVTHGLVVPHETLRTLRKRGEIGAERDGQGHRWLYSKMSAASALLARPGRRYAGSGRVELVSGSTSGAEPCSLAEGTTGNQPADPYRRA